MNRFVSLFALAGLMLLAAWPALATDPTTCPNDHCNDADARKDAGPCGSGTHEKYKKEDSKYCCTNHIYYWTDYVDHFCFSGGTPNEIYVTCWWTRTHFNVGSC